MPSVALAKMRLNQFLLFILLSADLVHAQNSSGSYRIAVVDGEGALNNVVTRTSREPVIQVSDANHRPVAGAYVEFDAPGTGPSAGFAGGSTHFATTTNADGLAVGSNIKNNGVPGSYLIMVHVSFQGQSIGEAQIHQANVSSNVSRHLQQGAGPAASTGEVPGDVTLSNNVLGVALGDEFLVNGASTPSNANLLKGTRIQALDKPTTLYLHDRCEYVLGPHSTVSVGPKIVTLETGSIRARRFGDCRIMYGGLFITGAPTADGVVALTAQNLDVAAVSGNMDVVNGAGEVISHVTPGTVSSYGTSAVSSGASVGGKAIPFKRALLLTSGVGIVLAGLGLATDAILQPTSSGVPTSP
jgi:hypothetical protein